MDLSLNQGILFSPMDNSNWYSSVFNYPNIYRQTIMYPVSVDCSGTFTWNGKSLLVFVIGQTMASPVRLLNKLLLITNAGRLPFCS